MDEITKRIRWILPKLTPLDLSEKKEGYFQDCGNGSGAANCSEGGSATINCFTGISAVTECAPGEGAGVCTTGVGGL